MTISAFKEWLTTNKKMGSRSANDVVSRLNRVNRIVKVDGLNDKTLELFNSSDEIKKMKSFVVSQQRRAIRLYLEFVEEDK